MVGDGKGGEAVALAKLAAPGRADLEAAAGAGWHLGPAGGPARHVVLAELGARRGGDGVGVGALVVGLVARAGEVLDGPVVRALRDGCGRDGGDEEGEGVDELHFRNCGERRNLGLRSGVFGLCGRRSEMIR